MESLRRRGRRRLATLRIERPCERSWEAMHGDETRRFCTECDKHVHDLSALPERDASRLLAANEELCVRMLEPARQRAALSMAAAALAMSAGCAQDTLPRGTAGRTDPLKQVPDVQCKPAPPPQRPRNYMMGVVRPENQPPHVPTLQEAKTEMARRVDMDRDFLRCCSKRVDQASRAFQVGIAWSRAGGKSKVTVSADQGADFQACATAATKCWEAPAVAGEANVFVNCDRDTYNRRQEEEEARIRRLTGTDGKP